ncbi:MAG: carbamate kinase [candidate division Zixibacteria bacterium]|nr:carbamate kinase [candidate division Zixibacteria bacterium]
MSGKTAVVALGGHAITNPDLEDTIANQFANTRESLNGVIELINEGYNLVITHGNGPQVGNVLLRIELARGQAPVLPLGVCVADTEGGMGYMIEQSLQNRLRAEKIERQVVTLITQVIVAEDDPAVHNPTKFIGQFYSEEEAKDFEKSRDWTMKEDSDRGYRRVVPSPMPLKVVAAETLKKLVASGTIVIAGGGGGIPVYIDKNGNYEGMDAVIDKDLASAVIGKEIGADILVILTSVDKVALNFGTPEQKDIDKMSLSEAKKYHSQGHFAAGSMGPKIKAAIKFLEEGGSLVTISNVPDAHNAILGKAGTIIVPD